MTVNLINALSDYKKDKGLVQDDFQAIAQEILECLSVAVKNEDLVPSYQMFILKKIELAFKVVMQIKIEESNKDDVDYESSEDMLDIPIEDFQGVIIDEEFDKAIGYVK